MVRNDIKVSVCRCVSNILLLFLPSLKNMFNVNSISVAPNNMSNVGGNFTFMVLFTNCLSEESSVRVMMIIYFIEEEFEAIERCDLMFLLLKAFFLRK